MLETLIVFISIKKESTQHFLLQKPIGNPLLKNCSIKNNCIFKIKSKKKALNKKSSSNLYHVCWCHIVSSKIQFFLLHNLYKPTVNIAGK